MKRFCVALLMAVGLLGCTRQEALETVDDAWLQPVMASPRTLAVQLPETAEPVRITDTEQLYRQGDREILVQTLASGDLDQTIRSLSGYRRENLTVLNTFSDGTDRYEFVWAATGEEGERLGHGVILDDGNYHYCLSAIRDAGDTEDPWQELFQSFSLI